MRLSLSQIEKAIEKCFTPEQTESQQFQEFIEKLLEMDTTTQYLIFNKG